MTYRITNYGEAPFIIDTNEELINWGIKTLWPHWADVAPGHDDPGVIPEIFMEAFFSGIDIVTATGIDYLNIRKDPNAFFALIGPIS